MPEVAAVYAHKGEEPPISGRKGITNIFFAHCNLQCIYCQNHQISRRHTEPNLIALHSVDQIVEAAAQSLQTTENMVGLVSATQYADLVPPIVEGLWAMGLHPTVVYNCGGYELPSVLQKIAPYIDIWLPDFKYSNAELARRYSNAPDYPQRAQEALRTMFQLVGSNLPTDDNGLAFRGMIVRHLVLPGQIENTLGCLGWIAQELSQKVHVSLMAQYYPPSGIQLPDQLNRPLNAEEYRQATEGLHALGLHRGWVQELEASTNYRPDFAKENIFSSK